MDMDPPDYLPGFNSPCWIECLPESKTHVYPENPYFHYLGYHEVLEISRRRTQQMTMHGMTWRLRCLPQFYLIGMPKCGTTDVFTRYDMVRYGVCHVMVRYGII